MKIETGDMKAEIGGARAEIISLTFTSSTCYYCPEQWEHKVEVETVDSETKELTGETVTIYACNGCRTTKLALFEDRIVSETRRPE